MENEQKTTKIRWEGDRVYAGTELVAHVSKMVTGLHVAMIVGKTIMFFNTEAETRVWVEQYLGVEEEKASDTKEWYDAESSYLFRSVNGVITERRLFTEWEPVDAQPTEPQPLIQWIDGEGFVDGVFRATVEKSAITHTNAGEKREKPLFRAFVIREDGVQSKAANCLDEPAAKRWCERMILGEG